jgi:antitoxin component YwqK of YwqJK toxin-antitoxin module
MYRIMNCTAVLIVLMLTGCGVKESLPEGVVHRTEMVSSPIFGEYRKEIYSKNSKPYQVFGFYKDGRRIFESYTTRLDTVEFTHYIEFYPSGEVRGFETTQSDKNEITWGNAYYPSGIMQSRFDSDTHIEEDWDETGAKEDEVFAPNSDIQKITKWYHNGLKKEEAELLHTQRNGKWFQWDSLGHQTRKEFYVNGKLKK